MYKRRRPKEFETYRVSPSTGKEGGTFYFTDCGNRMYSLRGEMAYHRKICPKCGRILFMRGVEDGTDK